MGDHDAGRAGLAHRGVHGALALDVEMAGRLIHQENSRIAIERAGDQHPLFLAAGQHRAHVADQRAVAHRHGADLVMDKSAEYSLRNNVD